MRLLDLFCGAGGAAKGYHNAGFDEIVGVDNHPQPRYPFTFVQADALEYVTAHGRDFDAIHASPPCQAFTAYRRRPGLVGDYPDLIEPVRLALSELGLPRVIENVYGAPLHNPLMICGTMYDPVMEIQRHRYFETNVKITPPIWPCRHALNGRNRFPGGRSKIDHGHSSVPVRRTIEIGVWKIPLSRQLEAMGIDWMNLEELSEAIPPAYTEFIGRQLLTALAAVPRQKPA